MRKRPPGKRKQADSHPWQQKAAHLAKVAEARVQEAELPPEDNDVDTNVDNGTLEMDPITALRTERELDRRYADSYDLAKQNERGRFRRSASGFSNGARTHKRYSVKPGKVIEFPRPLKPPTRRAS